MLDDFLEFIVGSCNRKIIKQVRQPYVSNGLELAAGCIPKSTGDVSLTISGRSFEYNMPAFIDVITGRKAEHFALVEVPVIDVFDALDCRIGI